MITPSYWLNTKGDKYPHYSIKEAIKEGEEIGEHFTIEEIETGEIIYPTTGRNITTSHKGANPQ